MSDRHYHPGLPRDVRDVIKRIRAGRPVYWPADPKPIDQTPYLTYAAKEGRPASE